MKTAIVTGAGRNQGIGAEICRQLSRKGLDIFFTTFDVYDSMSGISDKDYEKTLFECRSLGTNIFFRPFDLTLQENIISLFDEAEKLIGNIDILVNCICFHRFDDIDSVSAESLDMNFQVNVKSIALLCKEFYHRFSGTNGRVVNLSSTQNLEPLTTEVSYAFSKAVIPVIVSTWAPVMATKYITINAINPGAIEIGEKVDINTDKYIKNNLFGRLGSTVDVGNIVSFLVSEEGGWITGQTINSEGGLFRGIR